MRLMLFIGDDSISIKKVIQLAAEGMEWDLTFFTDGDALFSSLETETPHILFLSTGMPGKNVSFLINYVKNERGMETKTILMKGAFENIDTLLSQVACDGVLGKPFSTEEFLLCVDEAAQTFLKEEIPPTLPEEEKWSGEGKESAPEEEGIHLSFDDLEEEEPLLFEGEKAIQESASLQEGIGVYPLHEEDVIPNDEKTRESANTFSSLLIEETSDEAKEEKESLSNPFMEESAEDLFSEKSAPQLQAEPVAEVDDKATALFEISTDATVQAPVAPSAVETSLFAETPPPLEVPAQVNKLPTQKMVQPTEASILEKAAKEKVEEILWEILPTLVKEAVAKELEKVKEEFLSLEEREEETPR